MMQCRPPLRSAAPGAIPTPSSDPTNAPTPAPTLSASLTNYDSGISARSLESVPYTQTATTLLCAPLVEVLLRFSKLNVVCRYLNWQDIGNLARTCKDLNGAILGEHPLLSTQDYLLQAKKFLRNPDSKVVVTGYWKVPWKAKGCKINIASEGGLTDWALTPHSYNPGSDDGGLTFVLFEDSSDPEVPAARSQILDDFLSSMTVMATSSVFNHDYCFRFAKSVALSFATSKDGGRALRTVLSISDIFYGLSRGKFLNAKDLLKQISNLLVEIATRIGCVDSLNVVIGVASSSVVGKEIRLLADFPYTPDGLACLKVLLASGKCDKETVGEALLCHQNEICRDALIQHARTLEDVGPQFWIKIIENARRHPYLAEAVDVFKIQLQESVWKGLVSETRPFLKMLLNRYNLDNVCRFLTWDELEQLGHTSRDLQQAIFGKAGLISTRILKNKAKLFFSTPLSVAYKRFDALMQHPLTIKELAVIYATHGHLAHPLLEALGASYRGYSDASIEVTEWLNRNGPTQNSYHVPVVYFSSSSDPGVFAARNRLLDACLFAITHMATSTHFDKEDCRKMAASAALTFATFNDGGRALNLLLYASNVASKRSGGDFLDGDGLLAEIANQAVIMTTNMGYPDMLKIVLKKAERAAVSKAMSSRSANENSPGNLACLELLLSSKKFGREEIEEVLGRYDKETRRNQTAITARHALFLEYAIEHRYGRRF